MQLKRAPFIILFIAYGLLVLFNLNKIPIAWVDEIMMIDPMWNYIHEGHFIGKVWPFEGSNEIFLAYLPLNSLLHFIDVAFLPPEIFYSRFTWVLLLGCTCIFLFKYIDSRYHNLPAGILFLLSIFILDEGISNAMRSGRIEMPMLAILSLAFYLSLNKLLPVLQAFCISLLLIAHPGIYPVALVLAIELLSRKNKNTTKISYILLISLLPLLYLTIANFNFANIYQQLVVHGQEHDGHNLIGNRFYNHFIQRFLPIYKFQFYIILLNILVHISCIYTLIVKKNFRLHIVEISFLATSIFWFFSLAPFYRYSPVLVLLLFMHLPELYKRVLSIAGFLRFSFRAAKIWQLVFMFCFIVVVGLPFIVRNSTAILQRKERNEYLVYDWLTKNLENKENSKILLIDEPIGFYYAMQHPNITFTLPYAVKKYQFKDYDKVYYLTQRAAPKNSLLIQKYQLDTLSPRTQIFNQKVLTYDGLRLYQIKDEAELQSLFRK